MLTGVKKIFWCISIVGWISRAYFFEGAAISSFSSIFSAKFLLSAGGAPPLVYTFIRSYRLTDYNLANSQLEAHLEKKIFTFQQIHVQKCSETCWNQISPPPPQIFAPVTDKKYLSGTFVFWHSNILYTALILALNSLKIWLTHVGFSLFYC